MNFAGFLHIAVYRLLGIGLSKPSVKGVAVITNQESLRDVHKIKKLLDDLESFEAFRSAFPLLKPLLARLGVDTSSIERAFEEFEPIAQQAKEMSAIPDRFNDLLANQGWIMFERMNMDVAQKALEEAEAGDYEAADATLVKYFDPDFVERELRTMISLETFQPRMDLVEKALEDYRAGRYHASIPVVLAQIDGLVSELHEKQRGFFAEDADMQAWDSLAAHSKGLNQLSAIFRKGRRKTTSEPIDVPYRHGIMHGRDLGYANQVVAAKSWAALFAVREWAIKVERNESQAPPEAPKKGLRETIASIVEIRRETEQWRSWTPREVDWVDLEENPSPAQFEDSTPEKALAEYLQLWIRKNYGYMSAFTPHVFSKFAEEPLPLQMRNVYGGHRLMEFVFKGIDHSVPAIAEVSVDLALLHSDGSIRTRTSTFRMICEDEAGEMVSPGNPNAKWVVMNWNDLNLDG